MKDMADERGSFCSYKKAAIEPKLESLLVVQKQNVL